MSDDRQRIEARRREWVDAVNGRDVEKYLELLTEDIVWFPPGRDAFQGKPAFGSWLRPFFERFSYAFTIGDVGLRIAGRWAVERGAFQTRMRALPDGEAMQHAGRYLVIWRRDDDGPWRIERYVDET